VIIELDRQREFFAEGEVSVSVSKWEFPVALSMAHVYSYQSIT